MVNSFSIKKYAYISDKGPVLEVNEDDIEIDLKNEIFMVLDGFGGSEAGVKAVKTIKETISQFYTKVVEDPDSTLPFFYNPQYLIEGNALVNAFHKAHEAVINQNKGRSLSQMGGASVSAGVLSGRVLTIVSIGNCSVVVIRNNNIQFVSHPESYDFFNGEITNKFLANFTLNGLGLFKLPSLSVKEFFIEEDDKIIFLSDGAYNRLSLSEMKNIFCYSKLNEKEKINRVFSIVNGRGNQDNQTCMLLEF